MKILCMLAHTRTEVSLSRIASIINVHGLASSIALKALL